MKIIRTRHKPQYGALYRTEYHIEYTKPPVLEYQQRRSALTSHAQGGRSQLIAADYAGLKIRQFNPTRWRKPSHWTVSILKTITPHAGLLKKRER